jgi:multicomponent Na+:H+ antiporter subunit D
VVDAVTTTDAAAPLVVAGPILVACVLLAGGSLLPRPVVDGVATLTALGIATCGGLLVAVGGPRTAVTWLGGWKPVPGTAPVGIALVVDPVSAGLVVLIGVLGAAALLFSWRYFDTVEAHFHGLVLLFLAGMAGFVLAGDLFDMLVFFELMGAVGYALAAYKIEEARSLQGGLTFGVVNSLGAYMTLLGVGLLYARTGALGLAPMGAALAGAAPDGLVVAGFVLVCTGWLVKAAAVPFHFWLADAHAVAPSPVCVLFSGVMAPLGVYGVARVYAVVFGAVLPSGDVERALLVLGVVTAALGSLMCVLQRNIKRLLAYSTIAHIGLFLLGAASGPAGAAAWLLYLAGHAGVKAALFLLVGVLLARHGSVDEIELHGVGRRRSADRVVGLLFALAGLALAGAPPLGPGLGKAALESAVGETSGLLAVVVLATSVITGAAVLRVALRIFLGAGPTPSDRDDPERTSGEGEERETAGRMGRLPATMLAAPVALLVAATLVGTLPVVGRVAGEAGARLVDGAGYRAAVLDGGQGVATATAPIAWHPSEVGIGLATTAAAVVLALAAVHAERLPSALRRTADVRPAVVALERLHSGHVGDYVAWLLLGIAALAALVGLPLLV